MEKVLIIAYIEIFSRKHPQQKTPNPQFYAPYGACIGLCPNWFFQMPQKRHLPKISS